MPVFVENIDVAILRWVDSMDVPFLDVLAQGLSLLCEHGLLPLLLAIALIIPKKTRRAGAAMFIAFLLSCLFTNAILKPIVARPRPYDRYDFVTDALLPHDYSFPSGHTSFAFALAFAFFFTGRKQFPKWAATGIVFAALVGLSRIWLKVHYPSDVLVGAMVGTLCGLLASVIAAALLRKFENLKEAS